MAHRLQRVSDLIRAEVSDLLLRGIRDPRVTGFITVTSVEVANDLGEARVYVSVFGSEDEQVKALRGLKSAQGYVRREVTRRAKLRSSPVIKFFLDRSIERGTKILALMRELGLAEEPTSAGEGAAPNEEETL